MKGYDYIRERVIEESKFIIETGCTLRTLAKEFKKPLSTVHRDVTTRLQSINEEDYKKVRKILNINSDRAKAQIKLHSGKRKK